jgi:hypothetical protein
VATSINLGYCPWLAGSTFSDTIGRSDVASMAYLGASRGGVLATGTGNISVVAASGMNITVNPGTAIVPNSGGSGSYRVFNPTAGTLTVPTAPVSPNNRIDLICVTVVDNGNATSFGELQLVTGTPAVTPSAPALPTNSIALATIFVGFGVVSIVAGNITDQRIWTAAPGGVINCPNMSSLPTGDDRGTIGYDTVNQRYFRLSSSGAKPFSVLSFPAAHQVGTTIGTLPGHAGSGGAFSTLVFGPVTMSTTVACDGVSDLLITANWAGFAMTTPVNSIVTFGFFLDGSQLCEWDCVLGTAISTGSISNMGQGGTSTYITSTGGGDRPAAGSHTVTWQGKVNYQSTSQTVSLIASSSQKAFFRTQQVSL